MYERAANSSKSLQLLAKCVPAVSRQVCHMRERKIVKLADEVEDQLDDAMDLLAVRQILLIVPPVLSSPE